MRLRIQYSISLLICLAFFACKKDAFNPNWDVDLLAPLANSTLSIPEITGDVNLSADSTSLLSLQLHNEIYHVNGSELFVVPDTNTITAYILPFGPLTVNPGQALPIDSISETKYALGSVELNTLIISSGKVKLDIISQIRERTTYIYSIPKATKNGIPFSISFEVPAASISANGTFTEEYSLAGYTFDLRGKDGAKVNTIYSTLKAIVSANAAPVVVNAGQSINISTSFINILPYFARGYFGSTSLNVPPASTSTDIFKNIVAGRIALEQLDVQFTLENNIGIDAQVRIDRISMENTNNNTVVDLEHSIINSPMHINRAVDNPLKPSIFTVRLDKNNSNIIPMVEVLPNRFGYEMFVDVNPLGNISGGNDFMYYALGMRVFLDMEMPLSISMNRLTFEQTTTLNIKEQKAFDRIKGGDLILNIHNGFPFSGIVKLYLLDANSNTIDSMTHSNAFDSGILNSNQEVLGQTLSKLRFPIDQERIPKLLASESVKFLIELNTASAPPFTKIYSHYKMDLNLVADFTYNIE